MYYDFPLMNSRLGKKRHKINWYHCLLQVQHLENSVSMQVRQVHFSGMQMHEGIHKRKGFSQLSQVSL